MFYNQPLATRFGTDLIAEIVSGGWAELDIAVAWVRASGMRHLESALIQFLKAGNKVRVVVGVDLDNTTKEGLEALLNLEAHGSLSIFVYHNEAGTIFHPKLYLFRNVKKSKLIVGSNNLTEAGLFRNTEAGLELEGPITDPQIVSAINALESWCDTSLGLSKSLDKAFLNELVANGYVKDEATVSAELASRRASSKKGGKKKKLFGSQAVTAPSKPTSLQKTGAGQKSKGKVATAKSGSSSTGAAGAAAPNATGQVLLMRVRTARGTQIQIPLAVMKTPFFNGVSQVRSVSTKTVWGIHPTHPKGAKAGSNPNTLKMEMPETSGMADPVARFERTGTGIQYEVYDRSSAKGQTIMQALETGRTAVPPSTFLTVPSSQMSSTWWRFI